MSRTAWLLAVAVVTVLVGAASAGCSQTTTGEPTKPAVDTQQLQQKAASASEALKAAQAKVSQLATGLAALDAATSGLEVNSAIHDISTKLDTAIQETGDKRKAAIADVSGAINDLIAKVEAAAAKLPAGGEVQTKLTDLAQKLKDVLADLAAASSSEASSTP